MANNLNACFLSLYSVVNKSFIFKSFYLLFNLCFVLIFFLMFCYVCILKAFFIVNAFAMCFLRQLIDFHSFFSLHHLFFHSSFSYSLAYHIGHILGLIYNFYAICFRIILIAVRFRVSFASVYFCMIV